MAVARTLAPVVLALGLLAGLAGGARAEEGDIAQGSPKAPVTVIEYASVTCPHCARWETEVLPAFKRKYVDTGEVRYVLREFPTQPEELAEAGFMIARCAPPAKFYDVIETLFASQAALYENKDARAWLLKAGAVAGLGEAEVKACLESSDNQKAMAARINANVKAFDVKGTPTFFVNGKQVSEGEVTLADLDKAIAEAKAGPKPAAAHPADKAKPKTRRKSR
jgi:protein-disulfide isomerase